MKFNIFESSTNSDKKKDKFKSHKNSYEIEYIFL